MNQTEKRNGTIGSEKHKIWKFKLEHTNLHAERKRKDYEAVHVETFEASHLPLPIA